LRTLIIVKPDWAMNHMILSELNELIHVYGLNVVSSQSLQMSSDFWTKFYSGHIGANYFNEMIKWMSSSPSLFLVVGGKNVLNLVRWHIVGRNGTGLRGKYQHSELKNFAHASDSEEAAKREISLLRKSLPK
jgi:nucleoside-diphosphate kinase